MTIYGFWVISTCLNSAAKFQTTAEAQPCQSSGSDLLPAGPAKVRFLGSLPTLRY